MGQTISLSIVSVLDGKVQSNLLDARFGILRRFPLPEPSIPSPYNWPFLPVFVKLRRRKPV